MGVMKFRRYFQFVGMVMLCGSCMTESPTVTMDSSFSSLEEETSQWNLIRDIELSAVEAEAIENINDFSCALIRNTYSLSEAEEFCVSPMSAAIHLGMLANASVGELRCQILDALKVEDLNDLNTLYEKLMHYLPCEDDGSSLSINNQFWVKDYSAVSNEFTFVMSKVFNAGVEQVDFRNEETVHLINDWVRKNTNGKITSILDGSWQNYTDLQMISASTVYFKGDWSWKFDKEKTNDGIFHTVGGDRTVRMMHRYAVCTYSENDIVQSVTLSFEGEHNIMELYLPVPDKSLKEVIGLLNPEMQKELKNNRQPRNVDLSLPRFKGEMTIDLSRALNKLGINNLADAELSPIGLDRQSVNPIQKTSIKVDEDGAELAACTAMWVGHGYPTEDNVVVLEFNRPFLYIIRNQDTGAILMAGSVTDPK